MNPLAPTEVELCQGAASSLPYLLLHVEEMAGEASRNGREYAFWRAMAQLPAAAYFLPDAALRQKLMKTYSLQAKLNNILTGFGSIRKLAAAEEFIENKGWIMSAAVATISLHIDALLIDPSLNTIELALGDLPALVTSYIEMHEYLGASSLAISKMYAFNGVDVACIATRSAIGTLGVLLASDDALEDPQECTGFAIIGGLESLLQLMCAFPQWTQSEDHQQARIMAGYPAHSAVYTIMSLVDQLKVVFNSQCSFAKRLDFPWEKFRGVVQHTSKMLLRYTSLEPKFMPKIVDSTNQEVSLETFYLMLILQPQKLLYFLGINATGEPTRTGLPNLDKRKFEVFSKFIPGLMLQLFHALDKAFRVWKSTGMHATACVQRFELLKYSAIVFETWWSTLEPSSLGTEAGLSSIFKYFEFKEREEMLKRGVASIIQPICWSLQDFYL